MRATLDVLCIGEALWDLTAPSSFAEARSLSMRPGGAAVNVALSLAKQGLAVGVAGVIGDDALGEALAQRVAEAGVEVALDRALLRTGLVFAEHGTNGPRFVGYRPLDEPAPRVDEAMAARFVLITGLLPALDHARALRDIARTARAHGASIVVDVNARPRLWRGRDPEPARLVIAEADVVKASEEDLRFLPIDARVRDGSTLITTRGAGPARASGSFGEVVVDASSEVSGDVLGAGDAFVAGVLFELSRHGGANDARSWERALQAGHASASAHLSTREP